MDLRARMDGHKSRGNEAHAAQDCVTAIGEYEAALLLWVQEPSHAMRASHIDIVALLLSNIAASCLIEWASAESRGTLIDKVVVLEHLLRWVVAMLPISALPDVHRWLIQVGDATGNGERGAEEVLSTLFQLSQTLVPTAQGADVLRAVVRCVLRDFVGSSASSHLLFSEATNVRILHRFCSLSNLIAQSLESHLNDSLTRERIWVGGVLPIKQYVERLASAMLWTSLIWKYLTQLGDASSAGLFDRLRFREGFANTFGRCSVLHPFISLCSIPHLVRHGIGLVAVGPISCGEMLIKEAPLLASRNAASCSKRIEEMVEEALSWCRHQDSRGSHLLQLLSLVGSEMISTNVPAATAPSGVCPVAQRLGTIVASNSMLISHVDFSVASTDEISDGSDVNLAGGSALYAVASRINHSCHPNALCIFSEVTLGSGGVAYSFDGAVRIRALRDIAVGEEIFISYAPILSSRESKRQHCHFDCDCKFLCQWQPPRSVSECATNGSSRGALNLLESVECVMCGEKHVEGASGHAEQCPLTQDSEAACHFASSTEHVVASMSERFLGAAEKFVEATTNEEKTRALQRLVQLDSCSTVLSRFHWLRLQMMQETCAAAACTSLTLEGAVVVESTMSRLLEAAEMLCPAAWPLVTGYRMHLAFAIARRVVAEYGSNCAPYKLQGSRLPQLIVASFREHCLQYFGCLSQSRAEEVAMVIPSYLLRYGTELELCGVTTESDMAEIASAVEAHEDRE